MTKHKVIDDIISTYKKNQKDWQLNDSNNIQFIDKNTMLTKYKSTSDLRKQLHLLHAKTKKSWGGTLLSKQLITKKK